MDFELIIKNTNTLLEVYPKVKSDLLISYPTLCDTEIRDVCDALFWSIIAHDSFLKCKENKEIYRYAYKSCQNRIKNLLKRNKKSISIEEIAFKAGLEADEFIDLRMCEYQLDDIENKLDLELLGKEMPEELFQLLLMHYNNYKLNNLAEHFKVSRITIIRRLKKAKEIAVALLTGNSPPRKKRGRKK